LLLAPESVAEGSSTVNKTEASSSSSSSLLMGPLSQIISEGGIRVCGYADVGSHAKRVDVILVGFKTIGTRSCSLERVSRALWPSFVF
jgi:hypothetical protein